jgi:hypothetical protein
MCASKSATVMVCLALAAVSCSSPRKHAIDPTIGVDTLAPGNGGATASGPGAAGPDAATDASTGLEPGSVGDGAPMALAAGQSCTAAAECASGICVDYVCCSTECAGRCQACAFKYTGLDDGSCGPARSGMDPRDECAESSENPCGDDGFCDGAGACRKRGAETFCTPAKCSGGVYTPPGLCDGKGACLNGVAISCAPFPCEGPRCRMVCSSDQQCASGNFCPIR